MQDRFLKFKCLVVGYNYGIVRNASEVTVGQVRKFFSAILIVSALWAFLGYAIGSRYFGLGAVGASVVSLAFVFIVVNIERVIILGIGKSRRALVFRLFLAFLMAAIGGLVIDQILFKDDVEKHKVESVQKKVDELLPRKAAELDWAIANLDSTIRVKEQERLDLINEVSVRPFVKGTTTELRNHVTSGEDSQGRKRDTVVSRRDVVVTDVLNPKRELIPRLENQISALRASFEEKQASRLTIKSQLEAELKSKVGLLDEVTILFEILRSSIPALMVWVAFFLFLLLIEMLVIFAKYSGANHPSGLNEYERIIMRHMELNMAKLEKLPYEKAQE